MSIKSKDVPNPPDNPGYKLVSYQLTSGATTPLKDLEDQGYRIVPGTAVVSDNVGYVFMEIGYK